MAIEKALVIDDEAVVGEFFKEVFERKKIETSVCLTAKEGLKLLRQQEFDLLFVDMKLPDLTGIDVLKALKEMRSPPLVVVITAFGSIDNAVEAMRLGAFNYLLKPFSPETIDMIVDKAAEHRALLAENAYLREEVSKRASSPSEYIVACSPFMKNLMGSIGQIANSSASVFITGESGTGKEVVARTIHERSPRSRRPFIKVNCAAMPETLIESEFFGHEKGAFTGAQSRRLGRFELADGGTLLLDEISEVPPFIQAKLLRATQEQEFERVGGSKSIHVDVRLISTSNRDVKEMIERRQMREDLYYRLNVIPIHLPPIRERREDILPLSLYFLEKFCLENHTKKKRLSSEAKKKLLAYSWPGNVRELANVIERAVVLDLADEITPSHLFLEEASFFKGGKPPFEAGMTLGELEKKLIIETLHSTDHNPKKTAEALGISPKKLLSKLKEHNIAHVKRGF